MKYEARAPMAWVRYAMQWIIDDAVESTPHGGIWVEVGVGTGRGIGYMARALIDSGRDDITLYAVDPWAGTARCGEQTRVAPEATKHGDWALFLEMMHRHAPEELRRIHILRATSREAWYTFNHGTDKKPNLVIIDGDHSYSAVREDLQLWGDIVDGVIGGDDITADSDVERAVLEKYPACERRGNPHSEGHQADWPTFRQVTIGSLALRHV